MRDTATVLLATADPMLDWQIGQAMGGRAVVLAAETAADCLAQIGDYLSGVLLLSPALAPAPGALAHLVSEIRARQPALEPVVLAEAGQPMGPEFDHVRQILLLYETGRAGQWVVAWLTGAPPPTQGPPISQQLNSLSGMGPVEPDFSPAPNLQQMLPKAAYAAPPAQVPTDSPEPVRSPLPSRQVPRVPDTQPPRPVWGTAQPRILRQKVVAFWGGKGGTGRSTMVTSVADLLCRIPGVRICTVDLNPHSSSLATLLRKETERNSWWLLGETLRTGQLTAQAVRESLVPITPQWSLLSSPAGSEQWCGFMTPDVVAGLIDALRTDFDYILLDLPAGRTPAGDTALAVAQIVVLVVSAFFPDVVDTVRTLEQALADGFLTKERCRLVLSQWIDSGELPASDVAACLELPVSGVVPLAPAVALAAARTGRPVTQLASPEAKPLIEALGGISRLIADVGAERPQKRGWFGR
ncbi:MAG TPA: P-loop NTPase [Symbiobacteriaceae bacterium]|nr:P-loop NTPase [Symbiobacteriaceae bacterium]